MQTSAIRHQGGRKALTTDMEVKRREYKLTLVNVAFLTGERMSAFVMLPVVGGVAIVDPCELRAKLKIPSGVAFSYGY